MKTITTPQGKVIVDEIAEIKGLYHDSYTNKLYTSNGAQYVKSDQVNNVVASINHSISLDVPMVIVDNELENIQSLKQENIELDMEYLSNDGIWKCVLLPSEWEVDTKNRIKTDRVDGQLIAYVKTKS